MPFDAGALTRAEPSRTRGQGHSRTIKRALRWCQTPIWLLGLFTGAKSFVDNPIIGSKRLNRAGLHVWRLIAAHRMAAWRRARLGRLVPADLRSDFDRDGFLVIPDLLPADEFAAIKSEIASADLECRSHQQGDTVTTRLPVGPELLRRVPALAQLLNSARWKGLMAYVASTRAQPLYYFQAISGGVSVGPADPQLEIHSDTFQPSLKAWLFLTDVPDDGRPLTYVAGSHLLTRRRMAWERRKSIEMDELDVLSRRGSLRVRLDELRRLGLPKPTHFAVPANTLVVADTCGFHARAASNRPTLRIELWAYCRRTPLLPWTSPDFLSWQPLAIRRAGWMAGIVDWLDRRGWKQQHWRRSGPWARLAGSLGTDDTDHRPIVLAHQPKGFQQ